MSTRPNAMRLCLLVFALLLVGCNPGTRAMKNAFAQASSEFNPPPMVAQVDYDSRSKTAVIDVQDVDGNTSMRNVFVVLTSFAGAASNTEYAPDAIRFEFRGEPRFVLTKSGVDLLAQARYHTRIDRTSYPGIVRLIQDFPQYLNRPDGSRAFPSYTGGWLGTMAANLENSNRFHHEWYLDDLAYPSLQE